MNDGTVLWHDIAFFVFDGFQLLDLAGPLSAFELASNKHPQRHYRLHVVSAHGGIVTSSSGLAITTYKARLEGYDTIIVIGGSAFPPERRTVETLCPMIKRLAETSKRISSVCTGAYFLAAVGLLDGRHATTHWKYAARLQSLFPAAKIDGDRIFVRDGKIWSSAGISAGIDLALAMIEEDLGIEVSVATAQMLVVYHRRPGGQSQFSALLDMEPESVRIRTVLTFARQHIAQALPVARLAHVACLSPRQFSRVFYNETGETPAKAVERLRVEAARPRIEQGREPIEYIARNVGFTDPERMRRAFVRIYGHPPQSIRRMATK